METNMLIRPSRQALSRRLALGLLGALALSPAMAQTDNWPAKPIRMVVPFPAGGGTDIIAREVTQKMAATNKWTFVIDNKPGSGGNIGIDNAAKSSPDGYSLVIGQTSNLAINPSLYSKLPYDPVKDHANWLDRQCRLGGGGRRQFATSQPRGCHQRRQGATWRCELRHLGQWHRGPLGHRAAAA